MSATPALVVVGLSHRTAPVALRERLAFREEDLVEALAALRQSAGAAEATILSTCNRVELYVAAPGSPAEVSLRVRAFLSEYHGVAAAELAQALYERHAAEAVRHLFEVAASIDSQILGETEIQAQTKEAYRAAAAAGAAGPLLRRLFERALFLAKEVRASGGIGAVQASISSAAVQLARKIFDDLKGHRVLVAGTGEMARGILRALRSAGVADVVVLSRTLERAEAFAQAEGGRCGKLEDLDTHLAASDIVLVSTAAPHYILRTEHMERAHAARHGRPLFVIDISVPRNVDPAIHKIADTFLYDIDDLEEVADEGRRQREEVARHWTPRLSQEAQSLLNEMRDPGPGETARDLVRMGDGLREAELERLRSAGQLDEAALRQVEQALQRMQGKLLHGALAALREAARAGDGAAAVQWANRFFRLSSEDSASATAGSEKTASAPEQAPQPATERAPR